MGMHILNTILWLTHMVNLQQARCYLQKYSTTPVSLDPMMTSLKLHRDGIIAIIPETLFFKAQFQVTSGNNLWASNSYRESSLKACTVWLALLLLLASSSKSIGNCNKLFYGQFLNQACYIQRMKCKKRACNDFLPSLLIDIINIELLTHGSIVSFLRISE